MNGRLIEGLLDTGDVGSDGLHFGFRHTADQIAHHAAAVIGAKTGFKGLQLGNDILRMLALECRPSGRAVTGSTRRMTTAAGGDTGIGDATAVDILATSNQIGVESDGFGRLAFVKRGQILHVLVTQRCDHAGHLRIDATTFLEVNQLLVNVTGVLPGKRRPKRVAAVAIDTVATGADGGFCLAGFGIGSSGSKRDQAGQCQHDNSKLARFHGFSRGKTYGNSGRKCISYTSRPFNRKQASNMTQYFRQARFITSAFELSQLLPDSGAEVAFAGRSNAGKSSAINCLTQQKNLCKTSKTPGRTQLINFFEIDDDRRLVDLPGYGFAKVSKQMRNHWDKVLSTYLLQRQALRGLIIVVDIRRGISDLDQALIDMMAHQLPLHILLTKADKLSRDAANRSAARTRKKLETVGASVSTLSIQTRAGLEELENVCATWLELETAARSRRIQLLPCTKKSPGSFLPGSNVRSGWGSGPKSAHRRENGHSAGLKRYFSRLSVSKKVPTKRAC